MMKNITRGRIVQLWFGVVAVIAVAGITWGTPVTVGTAALLAGMCLVPPAFLWMLWPTLRAPTIAEVLHDTDPRG